MHIRGYYRWVLIAALSLMQAACLPLPDNNNEENLADMLLNPATTSAADIPAGQACLEIGEPSTEIRFQMLQAINNYRIQNGLDPLIYSESLERAISLHVEDLWERDFFDHTNPDGLNPGDRAMDAGFCHEYVGENIAAGQSSVIAVMKAWIDSPGHLANLLNADYVYVGMGHFTAPSGRQFWGQAFAYDVP